MDLIIFTHELGLGIKTLHIWIFQIPVVCTEGF